MAALGGSGSGSATLDKGNGFWPTGGTVNDGEEMGMLGGGGEGANEISVNV